MSQPANSTAHSNVTPPEPSAATSARRSTRKASIGPVILLILSLLLIFVYARSYTYLHKELGTWGCRMSWMAPNYVKMDGPEVEGGLSRKYGVYLYREGGLQGDVRVSSSC